MTAVIIRGDARALPLPDASVDLIVTSPPYWGLRDYRDGEASLAGQIGTESDPLTYIDALIECTAEWARVLKPTGSIFVNLGDKYANRTRGAWRGSSDGYTCRADSPRYTRPKNFPEKSLLLLPERYRIGAVDVLGLIARAVIIWDKPNGLPESVTDRVRRSHEDWVHLTKLPRYYSAVDEIREPHTSTRHPGVLTWDERKALTGTQAHYSDQNRHGGSLGVAGHPKGKLPGSVWEVATQPLTVPPELAVDHFAAFPMEFPRRLIRGWSPPDGLVVDPFGGTGTTALMATVLGRHGVSIDRSADYCRIAAWRTTDPGERARALEVPKPPNRGNHPTLFEVTS